MTEVPTAAEAVDAAGHNRYFGWYYGRPEELGPHLDRPLRVLNGLFAAWALSHRSLSSNLPLQFVQRQLSTAAAD